MFWNDFNRNRRAWTVTTACFVTLLAVFFNEVVAAKERLPATKPLTWQGDLSHRMRVGFDKFLMRQLQASVKGRSRFWQRNYGSRQAYNQSVAANRRRLARMIGAVDDRVKFTDLELVATTARPDPRSHTHLCMATPVRWPVFPGVDGEGLLLAPRQGKIHANVIVIPDADQTPEMLAGLVGTYPPKRQIARILASHGCRVLVPALVNRSSLHSGDPAVGMTNQPHREWIYRQAFQLGRHIIGYEVQKVRSLVDWLERQGQPIRVYGFGEGGLIALHTAALDTRITQVCVSGYFNQRQRVWEEPIYRNVFGLLREFGDAEVASLVAPRTLIVEYATVPVVSGPPKPISRRRRVASPGFLTTPPLTEVMAESKRLQQLCERHYPEDWPRHRIVTETTKGNRIRPFGTKQALLALAAPAKLQDVQTAARWDRPLAVRPQRRQQRQVQQLVAHTQKLLRYSARKRARFWQKELRQIRPGAAANWSKITAGKREYLWKNIIGKFPPASLPAIPRSRWLRQTDKWTAYEVVLDVYPDVFAWGILIIPRDIKQGEKRPVVVCQHGLEGTPFDVINVDEKSYAYQVYRGFAAKLADEGFITFSPHNFYRGGDAFRLLQRKAQAVGKTLFGLTTIQHQRILDWLSSLPQVDARRIGFYGLSYGGNTAMRVPALLDQYKVVIASGDFNEWNYKNATVDHIYSMIYHRVFEVFEWDLGHTFNHSELAALIAPRPFMVERGHKDGVALDEWVASEYARVRRLYVQLGSGDKTTIEFFNGPHRINGVGTFQFLKKHLKWSR